MKKLKRRAIIVGNTLFLILPWKHISLLYFRPLRFPRVLFATKLCSRVVLSETVD